ncbi:MAG: flagellar hook-basal body complex protein FliE [Lachnospira sp.]|nr:flagellar hook-basal body complex protein FliE [Lachnospira sp.]
MDLTSAIGSLGTDYITKISEAMNTNATLNVNDGEKGTFDSIFNAVSGLVESTNSYIQQAEKAEIDFALGKMNNTHELGVYQQQANIALQFTVAVRDKALEAYKEIMNMQI